MLLNGLPFPSRFDSSSSLNKKTYSYLISITSISLIIHTMARIRLVSELVVDEEEEEGEEAGLLVERHRSLVLTASAK